MILSIRELGRMTAVVAAVLLLSCGGPQLAREAGPEELLAEGKYEQARSAVRAGGVDSVRDRAIVALTHLAEAHGDPEAAQSALAVLREGSGDVETAASATEMLELLFTLPEPAGTELSISAAKVALGAVGHGSLAPSQAAPMPGSEVSRRLAVAVLERVSLWLEAGSSTVAPEKILDTWNGSFSLLGGSVALSDEVLAWKLFTSLGNLGASMHEATPDSDLTAALLRAAVSAVEENPHIAIPVRCDISSPFDRLRQALVRERELLGRLERAVAAATGCKRGAYAPGDD
ncbi:MAG: hypothetical protein R6V85_08735 [Polyangia bacterium]